MQKMAKSDTKVAVGIDVISIVGTKEKRPLHCFLCQRVVLHREEHTAIGRRIERKRKFGGFDDTERAFQTVLAMPMVKSVIPMMENVLAALMIPIVTTAKPAT